MDARQMAPAEGLLTGPDTTYKGKTQGGDHGRDPGRNGRGMRHGRRDSDANRTGDAHAVADELRLADDLAVGRADAVAGGLRLTNSIATACRHPRFIVDGRAPRIPDRDGQGRAAGARR